MGFVKVINNKAYFKRFQTKFRRRREGKTDYYARKRLVAQYKNRYSSPRYRFAVRFTNSKVICQIIFAELDGDKVICQAMSTELKRYGLTVGLKNYSAAYCTGLLCARRLLQQFGLDEMYQGNEADGTYHTVKYAGRTLYVEDLDWESERRPFRANLDVGIKATRNGARVFAAMKGAVDGGMDIPHGVKCFPGYDKEEKALDADELRSRIFGEHVADYMRKLKDEGEDEKYTLRSESTRRLLRLMILRSCARCARRSVPILPSSLTASKPASAWVTRRVALSQRKGHCPEESLEGMATTRERKLCKISLFFLCVVVRSESAAFIFRVGS